MATSVGIDVPGDPANGMPSKFTSACILKSSITYPKITARRYLNRQEIPLRYGSILAGTRSEFQLSQHNVAVFQQLDLQFW
ncbi:hypothetical protein EJB05_50236, partial [Eragrostis curvula]